MTRTLLHLEHLTFSDQSIRGWSFRELTGWWGGTGNKLVEADRPQGIGSFQRTRALRRSRVMTFRARFRGADSAEVERAYDELSAVGAEGPVRMAVTTDAGTMWRTVIVEDSDASNTHNRRLGWQDVTLTADDPRRYADAEWASVGLPAPGQGEVWPEVSPTVWPGGGSTGRVTLANDGRAPSPSLFVLTGGFSSALITCVETGDRVGFARPVPSGSSVTIDARTRRAEMNGQDVSRWLRFREWTEVPGQQSRTFQFNATDPVGLPEMAGKADHAWW
ncbi:MAG: hypothetical protein K0S37_1976 [Microbacterium sp.]|nr:hypothetical protein [Microbacterium sp.]